MKVSLHFFISNYFQNSSIFWILTIASKKSDQNQSNCILFLLKKELKFIKKNILSDEKMRNLSINVYDIYDNTHSLFGEDIFYSEL